MFNFQDCGETKKETLEPDDIDAICTIYPTAKDPGTCAAGRRAERVLQHRQRRGRSARRCCSDCLSSQRADGSRRR